jgi:4-carboxymuconolactone decarboxylase
MARLTFPTPDDMDADQLRVYNKIISGRRGKIQGPLRAALYNAELADRWQALGELLRYNTTLTPRLSELAILVTGRACQSPFEWYAHRLEAEKVGFEPALIEALLAQQTPEGLTPQEAIVHRVAVELNQTRSVSDDTYPQALALLGARGLVELTALVGYYTMVALTLNTHEIPLPEGVAPAFPLPQKAGQP